jgi:hypothetical protein
MKKLLFSLLVVGLIGFAPNVPSQINTAANVMAQTEQTLTLDVACDCRTFAFNRGVTDLAALVRGDGFIVNGKIFPAGTLPAGPATNDPNDPGSIGDWICRGTLTGATDPVAFITQYHLLNNGGLVSEGPTGEPEGHAAVVGGLGSFSGAKRRRRSLCLRGK